MDNRVTGTPRSLSKFARAMFVLIVFYYSLFSFRSDFTSRGQRFVEYGWPLKYTSAVISPDATLPLSLKGAFDTSLIALTLDVIVASAFVLVGFIVRTIHLRVNHGRLWTVRFSEIAVAISLLSFSMAFYYRLHKKYLYDLQTLQKLEEFNWRVGTTNENLSWYLEPLADIGIIERDNWLYLSITYESFGYDDSAHACGKMLDALSTERSQTVFVHEVLVASPSIDNSYICNLSRLFGSCRHLELIDAPLITLESLHCINRNIKDLKSLSLLGTQIQEGEVKDLIRAGMFSDVKVQVQR